MNPDGSTDAVTHITRDGTRTKRSWCGTVALTRPGWTVTREIASNPMAWQSIGTVPRNALCAVCCQRARRADLANRENMRQCND